MPREIAVRMAEIHTAAPGDTLVALGLGSCIAVCIYDPGIKLAGCAHVVLPDSTLARKEEPPGKFADTAVDGVIQALLAKGASRSRLKSAIAGGAHVFNFSTQSTSKLDIGERNASAVIAHLKLARIPLMAQDCGGPSGRTLHFYPDTGLITVRTAGSQPVELACLGSPLAAALPKAA